MSFDRLLGTWDITMHHSAMAEPVTSRQRYEPVLDGAYVLLNWTNDHPDFPDAMALLSDEKMYYFDVRGVSDGGVAQLAGYSDSADAESRTAMACDRRLGTSPHSVLRDACALTKAAPFGVQRSLAAAGGAAAGWGAITRPPSGQDQISCSWPELASGLRARPGRGLRIGSARSPRPSPR